MFFKKWKKRIYDEGFYRGRDEGLTTGYNNGLQIGYQRGFADGSSGGIMINEFGVFLCNGADNFQALTNLKDHYKKVDE